ncbi:hypothetical protein Gogos_009773, partial [Gossypium gossypioides]|nr:hypothetical protein [Gossypium gossypioides]
MSSSNPFDLLGDDDTGELSLLIAAQKKAAATAPSGVHKKGQAQSQTKPQAKLPSKPLPPAQAVREAKSEGIRGGGRGGRGCGGGGGRGGSGGYRRDFANDENPFSNSAELGQGAPEDGESRRPSERRGGYGGPRPYRGGGRRGGFSNGEIGDGERPRRVYERSSGTGRGNELEREGFGRRNWGTQINDQVTEEVANEGNQNLGGEKLARDGDGGDADKESLTNKLEEKEPEEKVMTLEEYEKLMEEKRKALQALKTEGRKVDAKEFESMQQLSNKKSNDEIFIKLGSDKDKRKEAYEKEERAKKVFVHPFIQP